jgi:hypothetical protein
MQKIFLGLLLSNRSIINFLLLVCILPNADILDYGSDIKRTTPPLGNPDTLKSGWTDFFGPLFGTLL